MHLPPDTSLAARLAEAERDLADLRQSGGRVYNPATGAFVPLSSLAFGLVAASDASSTQIDGGVPGAPGALGWYYGSPSLDVFVNGGGLLVFTAASITAQGNKASMYQSYRLLGPGTAAGGNLGAVPAGPAYDRAVEAFDPGYAQGTGLGAGTFGVHTGLTRGWYRVQSAYALTFSGGAATYGDARNRRIAAMPF